MLLVPIDPMLLPRCILISLLFQLGMLASIRIIAVDSEGSRIAFGIDRITCTGVDYRETVMRYRGAYQMEHVFQKENSALRCAISGRVQKPSVQFSEVIDTMSPDELGILTINTAEVDSLPSSLWQKSVVGRSNV